MVNDCSGSAAKIIRGTETRPMFANYSRKIALGEDVPVDADICKRKAEECLALAEKSTDPMRKQAMLRFAEWWTRLSNYYSSEVSATNQQETEME